MVKSDWNTTHPFITFTAPYEPERFNLKLGEAFSKCQHLSGTPLPPKLAQHLSHIYFARGIQGTTAIEGNTLSEADVSDVLAGKKQLPESRKYQEVEVLNVAKALTEIRAEAASGKPFRLTPNWIREQNRQVLDGLDDLEDHVVPGEYTREQVVVGSYRPPRPNSVPELVDRLCDWLNSLIEASQDNEKKSDERFLNAFMAAALGHLYVAWIHPFGDGNGRTARLLEAAILAHSGVVPWVSCQLLSNFYNETRPKYYRKLDRASKAREVSQFILYSIEGYVDELRDQISVVQAQQRHIAWMSYVHEVMQNESEGKPKKRRSRLALALHPDTPTPKDEVPTLETELAFHYGSVTPKTVSRDLSALQQLGLVRQLPDGWVANQAALDAFVPLRENFETNAIVVSVPEPFDLATTEDVEPASL
ncbi:Fic family protein [Blastococcus sp. Marseille-P5729]|uniref:Fic family protein n=1 Tax=Blastococcus sp. Marseille-P5729 TaxID=2086582 RepID=UPI000D0E5537|nr:Fic family protein [Blastococcus sp. Marseille-P5729]